MKIKKDDPVVIALQQWMQMDESSRESLRALARRLGVSDGSLHRRKNAILEGRFDEYFTDIPVEIISSRGKTVRLPDGSYEKVTYHPAALAVVEALKYEDVAKVIEGYEPPAPMGETVQGALIVSAADFQVGKTDERGGVVELVERVVDVQHQWESALPRYEVIVLADLGDVIEGFSNTAQQQQTNALSLTDQIRLAQRLLLETLKTLAPKCDRLIYAAVPSNHAAVRSGLGAKNRANSPDDDFGLLIQENIKMALEQSEYFNHVEFVQPGKWEEAVTVSLPDGTGVAFTHGDLAGSLSKMDGWFAALSHGRRCGLQDAHILLHGHFHTPYFAMSGDSRWIVGAPSLDNGSAWYANRSGKSSPSAMLTFEAVAGRVENYKLWYPRKKGAD